MSKQNALLEDITKMMTDPSEAQNDVKIESTMNKIRKLDPSKVNDQLRLASCHFMTMYHTRKAMTIGMSDNPQMQQQQSMMQQLMGSDASPADADKKMNLEAIEKFKLAQRKDMELGWNLLNIQGSNSQAARTARVLKIEVAQRLEDTYKLKQAFDDLMSKNLSDEETMVAFTAAPFLGDWKTMLRLGRKLEKVPGGMEQLHMMSLQLPIPDFTLIYDLCKEHHLSKQPLPKIADLTWNLLNVQSIRVKFKDVDCGEFEQKRQELLNEIQKQGDVEWEEVPNIQHVHVKRMGALCQAVSFGEMPMMLNGPWFNDKIHVKGRAEMPMMNEAMSQMAAQGQNPWGGGMPSADEMVVLVQEEEWKLTRDQNEKKKYVGTYALRQHPMVPPNSEKSKSEEHAPVNMIFDCEVTLGEEKDVKGTKGKNAIKSSNDSDEKNPNDPNNINESNDEKKASTNNFGADEEMMQEEDEEQIKNVVTEFDDLELD